MTNILDLCKSPQLKLQLLQISFFFVSAIGYKGDKVFPSPINLKIISVDN